MTGGSGCGPPRVLVLRALGLGDFLTGVPAYRGLRQAFPEHTLSLAAPPVLADLVQLTDAVDEVFPAYGLASLDWSGPPPDVAVNLHGRGPQSHRLLQALRPARTIAYFAPEVPELAGPAWRADEHEVPRWCRLLESCGISADPTRLALRRPNRPSPAAGAVVVHPGAAAGSRRWPADRYAAVAAELHRQGHRVVLTGSADEVQLCAGIAERAGLGAAAVLAGSLGLGELAALVADAALVLCGDTGVAHLATAYATPSVVVFGPVSPVRWGPPFGREQHVALWHGGDGDRPGDPHADHPDPALLRITVDEVLAAAGSLLG
ncbi:MAG: glycosyltransferase family 9 protein [Acidothermales bacterium]|nr:glycosyltransferase family 9 protein [Acidothermales bacterium]